jgi:prolyl 4-hydroxylase
MVEIEEEEEELEVVSHKSSRSKKSNTKTVLNTDPKVYTVDNFISDKNCQHFINISRDKIKQALVSGDKEGIISNGRTGQNCWIAHDFDKVTQKVAKAISELVGMPLENAESFQIIYYGLDEEYRQHYDGWLFDGSEKSTRNMKIGGQRMVTALAYLNTVPNGGGTKFTKLNKEVKSKKGKLLVFSNVEKDENTRHDLSEHAGMPVLEGEKWAFNLWFREKSRKFEYNYIVDPKFVTEQIEQIQQIQQIDSNTFSNEEILDTFTVEGVNNNIKFEVSYDNLPNEKSEINIRGINEVISNEDIINILKLCNFADKDRSSCWVHNNKIVEIITKLQNIINIDSSYFENMCVTKYKEGVIHKEHLDAYDLNSENGKKYTNSFGQRLLTITGFLSSTSVKFPKIKESYKCETGSIIYYNNCYDNSNERNDKYLKNYSAEEDSSIILFNIYIREKSKTKTTDKIVRLNGLLSEYKSKEDIDKEKPIAFNQHDLGEELGSNQESGSKGCPHQGFKGDPLKIIENIYTKSVEDNLKMPDFKMVNKGPISYVKETLEKIKDIRDTTGFLASENLEKEKEYMIDEYNPVTIENVINPEIHSIVNTYFKQNIKNGAYPLGDRQANRYKVIDEIMTRLLHLEFLPLIEKIVGQKVRPTYTYLSAYLKGTKLPPHTDRADCEFTCSYIIGKPKDSAWNIYIHKKKQSVKHKGRYDFTPSKDECLAVDCAENGLMIFNGTDHIHFREELEHDYYNVVLLHYCKCGLQSHGDGVAAPVNIS